MQRQYKLGTLGENNLNIVTYPMLKKTVGLVIVDLPSKKVTPSFLLEYKAIQDELNRIYKQAVFDWTLKDLGRVTIDYDNCDGCKKDGMLEYESENNDVPWGGNNVEIQTILSSYNFDITCDYYIFIVNELYLEYDKSCPAGFMEFGQKYGFVKTNKQKNNIGLAQTIGHELGHGAFSLYHPFQVGSLNAKNYLPKDKDVDNLMNWGSGIKLRKFQWDKIHLND